MDTVRILKEARALISDEKNWTQDSFARNSAGEKVEPANERAVCFCAIGALAKAACLAPELDLPAENFIQDEAYMLGWINVPEFNDNHTHSEVLALFDRAIARAESEAA